MRYRPLGTTGWQISEISFGAWAIGGSWGTVNDAESLAALQRAMDLGVNFIDTADVYGDGRSERLVGEAIRSRRERVYVATKAGRRLSPHIAAGYTAENLEPYIDRSLRNLGTDRIDLLQLHCPPTEVYYRPELFDAMDRLVQAGKLRHYGVSVEKVEEALKAIEYPGVRSVQIIYNIFRQRPAELFFKEAARRQVGILARVPLASGLLTGRMTADTQFQRTDHRKFNRHGEAFDRGETFSGVDYQKGLDAVEELRGQVPAGWTLSQLALRWILMSDSVSCAIPGARNIAQVEENARAAALPPLEAGAMKRIAEIYNRSIRPTVHHYW